MRVNPLPGKCVETKSKKKMKIFVLPKTGIQESEKYAVGRIEWYRQWSLAPRPARTWMRDRLVVTGRVPLDQAGQSDQYLVQCRYDGTDFELSMSTAAYAGLASWLEAAPPGRHDLVL